MTNPIKLEKGMRVRWHNRHPPSYGDSWRGWYGRVLAVDHGTRPFEFVRVVLDSPYSDDWHAVTWTERGNLRKLPGRVQLGVDIFCPECGHYLFDTHIESTLGHFITMVEQAEKCECGANPHVYGVRFE